MPDRLPALPLLALLAALAAAPARAEPQQVFAPPTGHWIVPSDRSDRLYGAPDNSANWTVSQWNSPEDLPPFHNGVSQNGSAGVIVGSDGSYTLQQSGQALTCNKTYDSSMKDVHEFDLFVSPIGSNRPSYRQAALGGPRTLAALAHIYHRISVRPAVAEVLDNACPRTKSTLVTSVTLSDPSTHQTLFYQLRLGTKEATGEAWTLTQPFWFARGEDPRRAKRGYFGYDDSISSFGAAPVALGVVSTYAVDLLPRLVALIREGDANGLDQNLNDWSIKGAYFGQIIWGHIRVRTNWSKFSLAVD